MEGPTPVSALIHAATMVTAGIYMLLRCSPLLEYAPNALSVIAFFGASTAFFAAGILKACFIGIGVCTRANHSSEAHPVKPI